MSNRGEERNGSTPHESEEDIIRRAVAGDVDAFGELVRKYQGRLFNLIGRLIGRPETVEDLAQEVFLKAYRKLGGFRFESSFFTWLYAIALNTCRNYYRRKEPASVTIEDGEDAEVATKAALHQPADEVVFRRQRAAIIREALDKLIPEQKEALIMCDLEGLSYQDIADLTGVPIGTVRSRIFRARASLRDFLPEDIRGV